MIYRIELGIKKEFEDIRSEGLLKDARNLGINLNSLKVFDIFWIKGNLNEDELRYIVEKIILDPIYQYVNINGPLNKDSVLITYKPGVFDSLASTLNEAIRILGLHAETKSGRKFEFIGRIDEKEKKFLLKRLLMNPIIEYIVKKEENVFVEPTEYKLKKKIIPLRKMDDRALLEFSERGILALTLNEMKKIKHYFIKIGRDPTDVELETIAQTWSEHCYHKTFRSPIEIDGKSVGKLFDDYIKKATEDIDADWTLSVFEDNAGVIEFDENHGVSFKVETHNHPSALEPYGGAGTGIGGVIRDTMGTGLGAKPIANTDIFCFGDLNTPFEKLPSGILHPRRIAKGVVAGVRDYGNRMGIPTVNGAICFDEGFLYNPLVFAGSIGIIPKKDIRKEVKPGYKIILVGGKTGKDGIHGATFSSKKLDESSEVTSLSSVQIGNPIEEKKMLDCLLKARDMGLYEAITDCGAGGLSSAVGEMGKDTGAVVFLERVPLKYSGLSYTEIWISESQERMVLAVKENNVEKLKGIFEEEDVGVTEIGEFTDDKMLKLFYKNKKVCELDMNFLHRGIPLEKRFGIIKKREEDIENFDEPENYNNTVLSLLAMPDIASKEWVIRQYDHEVQGGSVLKPVTGKSGPSDAAVTRPFFDSDKAIIISNGINPLYGKINPYKMTGAVIEEALRNLVAAGGSLKGTALLDNFAFGDTDNPEVLGDLYLTAKACYDYATYYGVPFISGKDSLHNQYEINRKNISIPPTLLISAIGILDHYSRIMTMDFKQEGNPVYLIGKTLNEVGGSQYALLRQVDGVVPEIDTTISKKILNATSNGIRKGFFNAVHDVSHGGIGIALAEMCIASDMGMNVEIHNSLRTDILLFSESNSRFIVEVKREYEKEFLDFFNEIPLTKLGNIQGKRFIITYNRKKILDLNIQEMRNTFTEGIKW